jgi:diguanylate cyclase (GGDEF)-like protein/PAS domain S-box-containing protein
VSVQTHTGAIATPSRWSGLAASLRDLIPRGHTLPDDVWKRRHKALLILLWLHVIGLTIFGLARGYNLVHDFAHGFGPAVFAAAAMITPNRRLASVLVSMGLVTCSALLVHIWDGVIEGHFHFFVMIVVLSLYEDWVPFLIAAAYVGIHHGMTGVIDPRAVYNHPDAIAHPWKWAGIHAMFVAAAGIASVTAWRLNEGIRNETKRAYQRALESEERLKTTFEEAPIGMALVGIEPGNEGRFLQVNNALCEITGYEPERLVGRHFREITYLGDIDTTQESFTRLANGSIPRFQVEQRYVRAEGEVVWALMTVSLVRDSSGNADYAIAQVQDINERKQAQKELAYQALHDSLTGLANRRSLLADLDESIPEATMDQPLQLLMFDLDGFKAYNDTFGHPAGDTLLARLGHNLAKAVEGRASAYRMGGDEFCVLVAANGNRGEAIAREATAALSEHGEGFTITASHGAVLLPVEAKSSAEALGMADQRMYARKSVGSRASAGRQSTDVLLRVLSERSPDLGNHLSEVTQLCGATAEKLEVPDDQLAALLQAASLHDVGKAAIPDEILDKPAPLSEQEWEFMRRHPVMGERILAAAPALTQAAPLVRHSHERFDGRGYPDGLAGEQIPLGARIIAVCDAFDAMTSERPYRRAMSFEVATDELRRCAGSQFDPRVVEAFVSGVAELDLTFNAPGSADHRSYAE